MRKIRGPSSSDSMNPFEYWYKTNPEIRKRFEDYFSENRALLNEYPQLSHDAGELFAEGSLSEKTQVLTLLAAIKLHF